MQSSWDSPIELMHSLSGETKQERFENISLPRYAPADLKVYQEWTTKWALQALRVLKEGGLMFVVGHPRTYHRMAVGIEDAGFEVVDMLEWVYWSGFSKGYDVSQGFDRKACRQELTEQLGRAPTHEEFKEAWKSYRNVLGKRKDFSMDGANRKPQNHQTITDIGKKIGHEYGFGNVWDANVTEPRTEMAIKWNGWKSARGLKPAHEPILVAQKPTTTSVCENIEAHGVGAINVDACRLPIDPKLDVVNKTTKRKKRSNRVFTDETCGFDSEQNTTASVTEAGRYPANLLAMPRILGENTRMVDINAWAKKKFGFDFWKMAVIPKPNKTEKDKGLRGKERNTKFFKSHGGGGKPIGISLTYPDGSPRPETRAKNYHPTVKPILLTTYLISLGCPQDGRVLDPFLGSGSTLASAMILGVKATGIERDVEYYRLARERLRYYHDKYVKIRQKSLEVFT